MNPHEDLTFMECSNMNLFFFVDSDKNSRLLGSGWSMLFCLLIRFVFFSSGVRMKVSYEVRYMPELILLLSTSKGWWCQLLMISWVITLLLITIYFFLFRSYPHLIFLRVMLKSLESWRKLRQWTIEWKSWNKINANYVFITIRYFENNEQSF